MVDESIIKSVRRYLRGVKAGGLEVNFGVVFGSRVSGEPNHLSDIDLLVVSPSFDPPRQRADIDLLWRVAARTDSRIEPVPCGDKQWYEDTSSAVVEIARREGQRVGL